MTVEDVLASLCSYVVLLPSHLWDFDDNYSTRVEDKGVHGNTSDDLRLEVAPSSYMTQRA